CQKHSVILDLQKIIAKPPVADQEIILLRDQIPMGAPPNRLNITDIQHHIFEMQKCVVPGAVLNVIEIFQCRQNLPASPDFRFTIDQKWYTILITQQTIIANLKVINPSQRPNNTTAFIEAIDPLPN